MISTPRLIVAFLLAMAPILALNGQTASAGSATVGGARMNCHAAEVVMNSNVPGPGYAAQGVIYLGTKYLKRYPSITQRLVFLHECGHQYVGTDENAADCWAIRVAKKQGWLTPAGIKSTCRAIWHTEGGDNHLPGPERCAAITQCYAEAPGLVRTAKHASSRKRSKRR